MERKVKAPAFSIMLLILLTVLVSGCGKEANPVYKYELNEVHPAAGRQGVCVEDGCYSVSGSTSLTLPGCRPDFMKAMMKRYMKCSCMI